MEAGEGGARQQQQQRQRQIDYRVSLVVCGDRLKGLQGCGALSVGWHMYQWNSAPREERLEEWIRDENLKAVSARRQNREIKTELQKALG
jgi:hypothetical protein